MAQDAVPQKAVHVVRPGLPVGSATGANGLVVCPPLFYRGKEREDVGEIRSAEEHISAVFEAEHHFNVGEAGADQGPTLFKGVTVTQGQLSIAWRGEDRLVSSDGAFELVARQGRAEQAVALKARPQAVQFIGACQRVEAFRPPYVRR